MIFLQPFSRTGLYRRRLDVAPHFSHQPVANAKRQADTLHFGYYDGGRYGLATLSRKQQHALLKVTEDLPISELREAFQTVIRNPERLSQEEIWDLKLIACTKLKKYQTELKQSVQQAKDQVAAYLTEHRDIPPSSLTAVFDADDTLFDNSAFRLLQALPRISEDMMKHSKSSLPEHWQLFLAILISNARHPEERTRELLLERWNLYARSSSIPPVRELAFRLKDMGIQTCIVTGRRYSWWNYTGTVYNLRRIGLYNPDLRIRLKDAKLSVWQGKAKHYQDIERETGRPVFLVVGDKPWDFSGLSEETIQVKLPDPTEERFVE